MTFKDLRLARTNCYEADDYVVRNVSSPRDLVFRPDIMDETVKSSSLLTERAAYSQKLASQLGLIVCSIQSIPKLRFCNLGCRLLLNQHHQHGSRRPRMFRPYSMNTLVAGGPTVVINHCALVDCFQLISSHLSHSQLDARSAAWRSLCIALLLSLSIVPTAVIRLHTDWKQKPLAPTSTGNSQVRQPFSLQRSSSSVYLAFFLS